MEIDPQQKITDVTINLEGINKIEQNKLEFIFHELKRSKNIEEVFYNIAQCNNKIIRLNIFDGYPVVKLNSLVDTHITIDYIFKERKKNYMIGTNVNNRGEITGDIEISLPYIFKSVNSIELKANISSLYTNNFSIRFVLPYIKYFKDWKFIFETYISAFNNIKCGSYSIKTNSVKTNLVKENHSIAWELNLNKIYHEINKNFIPSDNVLKFPDNHIKHTIKYVYKKDKLNYVHANDYEKDNENDQNGSQYTFYPTDGYYYEIQNEVSLPYCEANFFKNHLNFLYAKNIFKNFYSYIHFSNGIKYNYNKNKQYYLNNFNYTGSIGSSLIFRGFEYNAIGTPEKCFHFNAHNKRYDITYNYLGANFFTNIQLMFKYILNIQNINPMLFFYIQLGRLSDNFYSSFSQLKKDTRLSAGFGLMTYVQKNVALELSFNFPLLHQRTDKTKFFQVGLNFKAAL
ncbi:sorting assembly machinery 50 kDa subunit, putative [Plasmodium chabaudi chabaudi]|uniref:Sorting assembly machinery 50 kDa subunit, putative n=1 Tax=Plasmodium chabaudi chabaudi TaxID=31271 RepID=A0A1C6Y793_PLACU|nr:sorting assembly machinery 50 kDa subunit, putative [Plasmodium chabaudi chabaudi]